MKANNDLSIDWYRTPIEPELLQELNQRSDVKGLVLTIGHLSVIALTFTSALLAYAYLSWPWLLLALFVHGAVTKFSINAVHEFVHGTVFESKWLNTLFCHIYSFLGWIHPHLFWESHTEHHKFTMHPPHDFEVVAPGVLTFKHFLLNTVFDPYMLLAPIRGNLSYARGKFTPDGWEAYLLKDNKITRRKVTAWAWVLLLGHSTITIVSLYFGNWLIPVLTSLTPAYGGLLLYLCNTLQHTGLPGEVTDYRLSCRTVRLNRVLEFLYWHMNYHTEHHMYAAVPFYNLRKLHDAIRHDLPPTHNGLLSAWHEVIAIQHRLKEDPDYRYLQELPAIPGDDVAELSASSSESDSVVTPSSEEEKSDSDPAADNQAAKLAERDSGPEAESNVSTRMWECTVCGFIYDEALGMPDEGIPLGTAWDDIPDDWMCPDCGMSKSDFEMVQI